jgi:proline iminopeptidase
LDKLKAPTKAIVWFENSAHMMMIEEPGRVLDALLRFVRPCVDSGEKGMR